MIGFLRLICVGLGSFCPDAMGSTARSLAGSYFKPEIHIWTGVGRLGWALIGRADAAYCGLPRKSSDVFY
jgi:hypothetical protein